jgi:malate dehydrogenase (oxaloacetate-decarboxylating)(NADP+)
MFIFPGIGLAVSSTKGKSTLPALKVVAKRVSYRMLNQAAIALANSLTPDELAAGSVYPSIDRIRDVSLAVAVAGLSMSTFVVSTLVASQALELGLVRMPKPARWDKFLTDHMWIPHYADVVHKRD